jgi:hypothetical protein
MARLSEVELLQVRKNELVARSESLREELHARADSLQGAAEWVERGHAAAMALARFSSPLRSLFGSRKQSFLTRALNRTRAVYDLIRGLRS